MCLVGRVNTIDERFEISLHDGERGPELVAHVREQAPALLLDSLAPATENPAPDAKNLAMRRTTGPLPCPGGPVHRCRGGNGSFSGHHGGRRRERSQPPPLIRRAPRSGSPLRRP